MSELRDFFLNEAVYNSTSYESEWLEVSSISYITFSAYSSGSNFTMSISYSVDRNYDIVHVVSENVTAGNLNTIFSDVVCRYAKMKIDSFTSGQDLKAQAFISNSGTGIAILDNTGTGAKIYKPADREIRSFVSTDASVSITELADEIDLQVSALVTPVTLTSAGGTYSLVNDGAGPILANKGISTGTGISVADGGTDLTITNTAPDQTVALTSGTGISATGTYPNFTISNTAPDQTVVLTSGTGISATGTYPNFTITNTDPASSVTLSSIGTGTDLVSDGTGPDLQIKKLQFGSGFTINEFANYIEIVISNQTMSLIDTQVFTASGTWTKPVGGQYVNILMFGGGGGGGSGSADVDSNSSGGVGGLCSNGVYVFKYPVSELGATESVTVGAGGTGGASVSTGTSLGNSGSDGGDSTFSFFKASGGLGGLNGRDGDRDDLREALIKVFNYDSSLLLTHFESQTVGVVPAAKNNAVDGVVTYSTCGYYHPTGGGSGGGIDTSVPAIGLPSPSQGYDGPYVGTPYVTAIPAANNPGVNGGTFETYFGVGGSGGSATTSGNAYAGGNGGNYGGGGGGGGASKNGSSGAGGNGAGGFCIVYTYG